MDKTMKSLYKDVINNRLPEENIPRFFNRLVDEYHTMACVRLAMHYFSFYEVCLDEGEQWSQEVMEILNKINELIRRNIVNQRSGIPLEDEVRQVDKLRNTVMSYMKQLTSYTDVFQNYEYILNRIEYRFKEADTLEEDEEFAREILQFIFDTEDNMIINDKIREVIGQLPIRITKQRYFDLLRGSINEYKGAAGDTLDTYLYMLRTSAMLETGEEMEKQYPELWEQKKFLEQLNYKEIKEEEYKEAISSLGKTTWFLQDETTNYYSLQEIINDVYAILICAPYVGMGENPYKQQEVAALSIISGVSRLFDEEQKQEAPMELMEQFHKLEGVQEEISYNLTVLEDALYHIDQNHRKLVESIMADKLLNVLLLCRDLLSNSLFIDFYEMKSSATIDEARIKSEADRIIEELTKLFADHDRMIARAVMANTLNKMPVFFQNHKEVMDYVLYSLEKCSDKAEKQACMEIIKEIMKDE